MKIQSIKSAKVLSIDLPCTFAMNEDTDIVSSLFKPSNVHLPCDVKYVSFERGARINAGDFGTSIVLEVHSVQANPKHPRNFVSVDVELQKSSGEIKRRKLNVNPLELDKPDELYKQAVIEKLKEQTNGNNYYDLCEWLSTQEKQPGITEDEFALQRLGTSFVNTIRASSEQYLQSPVQEVHSVITKKNKTKELATITGKDVLHACMELAKEKEAGKRTNNLNLLGLQQDITSIDAVVEASYESKCSGRKRTLWDVINEDTFEY